MSRQDGLESFDGFTRQAASDGMFNGDQLDHMRYLSSLPREARCRCGWYEAGDCYNCNHDDFRRLGIRSIGEDWRSSEYDRSYLDYRLPNGCVTGYQGAIEWVKRHGSEKTEKGEGDG